MAVDDQVGVARWGDVYVAEPDGSDFEKGLFDPFLRALCSHMVMLRSSPPPLRLSAAALSPTGWTGFSDSEDASLC